MQNMEFHRRAMGCIAQGALTNSKRPESFVKGIYPTHLVRGHGCQVLSTEGRWYIDFVCGLGTNLLGYGNEYISREIARHAADGTCLSLSTVHEIECADRLKEFFPFVDAVKFLKTGSDACSAAIRIARMATGRDLILSEGYHGWHDDFVSLTPPAAGVPVRTSIRKFTSLDDIDVNVAAVIVEPVITDASVQRMEWLTALRAKCNAAGALLIFDEIITGFRWKRYGVSNTSGIIPDLLCLGKSLGGGLPLSAVCGKADLMHDTRYFVSSTFAGEILSLVAATAFLKALHERYSIDEIWLQGNIMREKLNELLRNINVKIDGYPTRGVFVGEPETKAILFQELCLAGILVGPTWFYNRLHADQQLTIYAAVRDVVMRMSLGKCKLQGEMPSSPFAQKVRES